MLKFQINKKKIIWFTKIIIPISLKIKLIGTSIGQDIKSLSLLFAWD